MPTAAQIDRACREGQFCYWKNRQQIQGAQTHYATVPAKAGHVWCSIRKTGLWEEIDANKVIITNEPYSGKKEDGMGTVSEIAGKRSGKRHGAGHTGPPSESAARAAAAKDKKTVKGNGADKSEASKEPQEKKRKWKPKSTVSLAKQGELPGIKTGERKIQEIETLAEKFEETKLAKAAADKDHKESDELLVAAMRRKKRVFYSRSTWGAVSVPDPIVHARFKREKKKAKG